MSNLAEVKPGIWWVGAVDWDERNIHGQLTDYGTSYNAYVILDEHPTLIDTVKAPFADELIANIAQVIDLACIEYIVSNHGEMDHSGALPALCAAAPNATVYSTAKNGVKFLEGEFGRTITLPIVGVKSGDVLDLGARTLQFVETPLVHWPDNMVTYCVEEKLLFSNDAFGQHYGTRGRFDDEVPYDELMRQVSIYYANIVAPFSKMVASALKKLALFDIETIAPAHGVIWRSHVEDVLAAYGRFARQEHGNDAVMVYDSMWGSTEKMARCIAGAFEKAGVRTHVYDLKDGRFSDALTDLLDAKYLVVGSPTRNNAMLPNIAYFMCEVRGLFPKGDRVGVAFGSYGWAPTGQTEVAGALEAAGYAQPFGVLSCNWVPDEADLAELEERIASGLAAEGAEGADEVVAAEA